MSGKLYPFKSWDTFFYFCLLGVAVSFIYSSLNRLGFSMPDDHWMLLENNAVPVGKYDFHYLYDIFKKDFDIQYSPLNTLYYSLVYKINGFDPYYYHLFNIILHIANAILVFYVVRNISGLFNYKNLYVLYVIPFLWAIFPVNVEPVVWISGSKILWCTFFTFVCLLSFVQWLRGGRAIYLPFSLLAFVVSFYFKEQALITPLLIFSVYALFYRESKSNAYKVNKQIFLLYILPMVVMNIFFGVITLNVHFKQHELLPPLVAYNLWEKVILIIYVFNFYFYSAFLPLDFHYHYFFPFVPDDYLSPTFYFSVFGPFLIAMALMYIIMSMKKFKNLLIVFLLFFLLEIFLELQIIPMTRPAIMADRFMYFPSIGLLSLVVITVDDLLDKFDMKEKFRVTLYVCAFIYCVSLVRESKNIVGSWITYNIIKQ